MELYANVPASQRIRLSNGSPYDAENCGFPRNQQTVLKLINPDDPAWPSVAAVLREMNDAGIHLDETVVSIATQLGRHRHQLAMTETRRTRRDKRVYRQIVQPPPGSSIVYYVRRGDLIKIGRTEDPALRFAQLMPDKILAVEPGGRDLEDARHRQFSHLHRRGEYFRAEVELLEHARQIRSQHGAPDPRWATTAVPRAGKVRDRSAPLPPLTSHETITAAEACRRFGITDGTVSGWVNRGLISPVGHDKVRRQVFYAEHLAALRDRNPRKKLARRAD